MKVMILFFINKWFSMKDKFIIVSDTSAQEFDNGGLPIIFISDKIEDIIKEDRRFLEGDIFALRFFEDYIAYGDNDNFLKTIYLSQLDKEVKIYLKQDLGFTTEDIN